MSVGAWSAGDETAATFCGDHHVVKVVTRAAGPLPRGASMWATTFEAILRIRYPTRNCCPCSAQVPRCIAVNAPREARIDKPLLRLLIEDSPWICRALRALHQGRKTGRCIQQHVVLLV